MTTTRRAIFAAALVLGLGAIPASAADKAAVGVLRFVSSGGLFLAVERGYFAAEGVEPELKFFEAAQPIAVAVASGDVQFGLTAITGGSLNLAGKGGIRIVASQGAEKKGITGNVVAVSNDAFGKGVTGLEKLAGANVAITQVGSSFHYQFGQIAAAEGIELDKITMKPLQSIPNMVAALRTGQVDAAILPPHIAGPLGAKGEVKLLGPVSDIADYQFGALFTSPKVIADQRGLVERFVRAYQRGLKDYNDALIRVDAGGKRVTDEQATKAAEAIGKYVYPSDAPAEAARKVIESAVYCDPQGRVDVADIERQIAWFKKEKLVDAAVEARAVVDTSFVK
jgi:NitT/TauT family transport system substrate-binding protein